MRRALVIALTAVGLAAACGGSDSSAPASSSTPPSSSTPAPSAGTPEQAAMQQMQQMQQKLQQGGQGAKAVAYTALQALLPDIAGWETQSGDLNVLVANRFIVHVSGHDLPNLDPIRAVVTAVPAARLVALVK